MTTTSPTVGLSLKPEYYDRALAHPSGGMWFEIHPENYMVQGGPRLQWIDAIRDRHNVSVHGVAMSLAGDAPPDSEHLDRFAALVNRLQPALVSEHLAWSTWQGTYRPDLLPFIRTAEAMTRIVANIQRVQDRLQRQILVENPTHYLHIDTHEFDEVDFLTQISTRSGCGLLVDVNNVFVSANNLRFSATDWLDGLPAHAIGEIHLAGHSQDPHWGAQLLVDSHDMPVDPAVWFLYDHLISRIGPRPSLIERDANVPTFDTLLTERELAIRHLANHEQGNETNQNLVAL